MEKSWGWSCKEAKREFCCPASVNSNMNNNSEPKKERDRQQEEHMKVNRPQYP